MNHNCGYVITAFKTVNENCGFVSQAVLQRMPVMILAKKFVADCFLLQSKIGCSSAFARTYNRRDLGPDRCEGLLILSKIQIELF